MPKETVLRPVTEFAMEYDDEGFVKGQRVVSVDGFQLEIGWSRDGQEVQLHVEHFDGGLAPTAGFRIELPRPVVNRAIRELRKARDQAFGRDE